MSGMHDKEWLKSSTLRELDTFLGLPRRAQELIFQFLADKDYPGHFLYVNGFIGAEDLKSPIEQIYYVAETIFRFVNESIIEYDEPISQHEIFYDNKKYFVDFYHTNESIKDLPKYQNSIYPFEPIHVAVECDGHEFHQKTKHQVVKDNERQLALQTMGYDVIRFSGSQIYDNPMLCVKKVHDFINTKFVKINVYNM